MKFHFTILFFLLFAISVFAQPQKGDFSFGNSNFLFQQQTLFGERYSFYRIVPDFGIFISDNTLVGGTFTHLTNGDNINRTSISVFANQYIGKGRLKGLGSLRLSYLDGLTSSNLKIGGAFFPVDNVSIDLVYNISTFSIGNKNFNLFPNKFRPNIGLSMNFFLLRNRIEQEAIIARNSIKEGIKKIGFLGNFNSEGSANNLLLRGMSKFFLKDNFFIAANLDNFNTFYSSSIDRKNQYTFSPQIGAGYYANLSENFALRFDALFSLTEENENEFNSNGVIKTRRKNVLINAGFAIFKGRHKIEPTVGINFYEHSLKDFVARTANDSSLQINVEYEFFLNQRTSLTGTFTALPKDKRYTYSRLIIEENNDFGLLERDLNTFRFAIGFNYYIMRQ